MSDDLILRADYPLCRRHLNTEALGMRGRRTESLRNEKQEKGLRGKNEGQTEMRLGFCMPNASSNL
jgi:hypothetical protein